QDALGERLREVAHRIALAERPERRRRGERAVALPSRRMAGTAIRFDDRPTPLDRLVGKRRGGYRADGDQRGYQQPRHGRTPNERRPEKAGRAGMIGPRVARALIFLKRRDLVPTCPRSSSTMSASTIPAGTMRSAASISASRTASSWCSSAPPAAGN